MDFRQESFQRSMTLEEWKLRIYSGDTEAVRRYYYYDEWCHQHFIFGNCKNHQNCKGVHNDSLEDLINKKKYHKAREYGEYLLFFYTYYCRKQKIDKKQAWIAHLIWKLAQIYSHFDSKTQWTFESQQQNLQLANQYYTQAVRVAIYSSFFCSFSFSVSVCISFFIWLSGWFVFCLRFSFFVCCVLQTDALE